MNRLLIVVNDAAFFLSHRLPIALAARDAGYDVHVATPADTGEAGIHAAGLRFHPIPLDRGGINPLRDLRTLIALVRLFRRLQPDLVHTVTIKPVIYGGIAARLTGVPAVVSAVSGLGYVFVAKGMAAKLVRIVVKALYRYALGHRHIRVIVQNPDDRELLISARIAKEDVIVLVRGSGADLKRFSPRPEPPGELLVLLASRMLRDKGVGEFVRAAERLKQQGVRARFALVGESDSGNPTAIPLAQLQSWHSEGVVEWWQRREDMPQVFEQAHIVCLPSYREGLPKVLIEAAAVGRAIVTTDTPGCREVVRHGENGLLVPVRDAEALARAIQQLLDNPLERQRMGAHGRAMAQAEFSIERVIRQSLALYEELLTRQVVHAS